MASSFIGSIDRNVHSFLITRFICNASGDPTPKTVSPIKAKPSTEILSLLTVPLSLNESLSPRL